MVSALEECRRDEECRKIAEQYELAHGFAPDKIDRVAIAQPNYVHVLGTLTRMCYERPLHEDGKLKIPGPIHCHDYGDKWPSGQGHLYADQIGGDENGQPVLIPGGYTKVTAHGIEDIEATEEKSSTADRDAEALAKMKAGGIALAATFPGVFLGRAVSSALPSVSPGVRAMIPLTLGGLAAGALYEHSKPLSVGAVLGAAVGALFAARGSAGSAE